MSVTRSATMVLIVLLIPVAHLLMADLEGPLWLTTIKDLLHVPAYAAMVVVLCRLAGVETIRGVLSIASACFVIATTLELSQAGHFTDLNPADTYLNLVGSAAGTCLVLSKTRALAIGATVFAMAVSLPLPMNTWQIYHHSASVFPHLIPPAPTFGTGLWRIHGDHYYGPAGELIVTFDGRPWPSIYRLEPPGDWSDYATLRVDVELHQPAAMALWIHVAGNQATSSSQKYTLQHGRQTLSLSLSDLDRTVIDRLSIYTEQAFANSVITLHDVVLTTH